MEPGFVTKIHFARYDRRELDTYYRASWSFGTVPLLPPKITENQFVTQKKSKAYLLNCNEKIMLRKHWNVGGNRGKKAFARSEPGSVASSPEGSQIPCIRARLF